MSEWGGNKTIQTDVRIVTATHRDLDDMIEKAVSGKIYITGSMCSRSKCRR